MMLFRFCLFFFGAVLACPPPLAAQAEAGLLPLSTKQVHKASTKAYTAAIRYPLLYPSLTDQSAIRKTKSSKRQAPSLRSLLQQRAMPEAFFCKLELKIDKAANMNCRFRLGSVDYVDYLEGKRRHY